MAPRLGITPSWYSLYLAESIGHYELLFLLFFYFVPAGFEHESNMG
jgi:hypothetical protein